MVDKEKKGREGLKKLEVSFFWCQFLLRLWEFEVAEDILAYYRKQIPGLAS